MRFNSSVDNTNNQFCSQPAPQYKYNTMNHHDELPTNSTRIADAAVPQQQQQVHNNNNHNNNSNTNAIWTCLTIGTWYCISSSIIWTTKWLFTNHFPYPLTVTAYSNFVSALWAALLTICCSGRGFTKPQPPSKQLLWNYVLPIGVCTALEIGCSNVALKILTVSFGTILKGTAPVFTFAWGLLFGLEVVSVKIGGSLVLIAGGIALASLGEGKEFQLVGFCLQMVGLALGGLRWAMTHKLLLGGDAGSSSNRNSSNRNSNRSGSGMERTSYTSGDAIDDNDNATYGDNGVRNVNANANANAHAHESDNTNPKQLSSLAAVLYTAPVTSICVLPFALALEWFRIFDHTNGDTPTDTGTDTDTSNSMNALGFDFDSTESESLANVNATHGFVSRNEFEFEFPSGQVVDASEIALIIGTMTLIATLVFVLLMSEYWLVKATSSLTLSVAGVFKELLTIGGGMVFFGEAIDALNVIGFVTCQLGIVSYVCLRIDIKGDGDRNAVAVEYTGVPEADEEETEDENEEGPVFA